MTRPTDGDAAGHGRGRGGRRRLRRGPDRRAGWRRPSPSGSARRRRSSCRRGRWPTRSPCARWPARARRSSPVAASTSSCTRTAPPGVNGGVPALHGRRRRRPTRPGDVPRTRWPATSTTRRRWRVVAVENTHMAAGRPGPARRRRWTPWPPSGLPVHLDGARLFNAEVRPGRPGGRPGRAGDDGDVLPAARGSARRWARCWPGRPT